MAKICFKFLRFCLKNQRAFLLIFLAIKFDLLFVSAAQGPLKFATQPTHQTAVIGSTVVLPCRIISGRATVQWTRDGFGLGTIRRLKAFDRYSMIGSDDEGDFSLRISPVTLEDDSMYQCQVSAKGGPKLRSRIARLTVFVPPDPPIISPSNEVETTAGINTTISCLSSGGRPQPEIQWMDESIGREIRSGIYYSESLMEDGLRVRAESKLVFEPTRKHHLRTLTCLTHNPALNEPMQAKVKLRVKFSPEIRIRHEPEVLSVGTTSRITCDVTANPKHVRYKWLRRDKIVPGANGPALNLGVLTRQDHGTSVTCEASNSVGTVRKTQLLNIQYTPRFVTAPNVEAANPGSEVTLKCDVDGNPKPEITWRYTETNKIIGKGDSITLRADRESAGVYTCVAVSQGFRPLEGRLHLRLNGPPVISAKRNVFTRKGNSVVLKCSAKAVPHPLIVTWTKDGSKIVSDSNERIIVDEKQQADGIISIIKINSTFEKDFGSYNCSVMNEYGMDVRMIVLEEKTSIPLLLVLGGVSSLIAIVCAVVMVIILGRKKRRDGHQSEKESESRDENLDELEANVQAIDMGTISTKQGICNAIMNTEISSVKSEHHGPYHGSLLIRKNGHRATSEAADFDRKEADNRGGSTLSVNEGIGHDPHWNVINDAPNYSRHEIHYEARNSKPALFNSQNDLYMPYLDYREYMVEPVEADENYKYTMGLTYNRASLSSDTYSTPLKGAESTTIRPLSSSVAPPPYTPSPNCIIGVNGLSSKTSQFGKLGKHASQLIAKTSSVTGSSPNSLSAQSKSVSNHDRVTSTSQIMHDLLADINSDSFSSAINSNRSPDVSSRRKNSMSYNHSKFILPPQASIKPGTLV